jgi:hypothetical protein
MTGARPDDTFPLSPIVAFSVVMQLTSFDTGVRRLGIGSDGAS